MPPQITDNDQLRASRLSSSLSELGVNCTLQDYYAAKAFFELIGAHYDARLPPFEVLVRNRRTATTIDAFRYLSLLKSAIRSDYDSVADITASLLDAQSALDCSLYALIAVTQHCAIQQLSQILNTEVDSTTSHISRLLSSLDLDDRQTWRRLFMLPAILPDDSVPVFRSSVWIWRVLSQLNSVLAQTIATDRAMFRSSDWNPRFVEPWSDAVIGSVVGHWPTRIDAVSIDPAYAGPSLSVPAAPLNGLAAPQAEVSSRRVRPLQPFNPTDEG